MLPSPGAMMIGGVAGGLAAYFTIDPLLVRLGFAILALANGMGLGLYVILWLLIPSEATTAPDARAQVRENVGEMQSAAQDMVQRVRNMFNS